MPGEAPALCIMLLIRSLDLGGAERQLANLARGLLELGNSVTVVTYYDSGPLRHELVGHGITVVSLQKRSRWDLLRLLWRLGALIRQKRPEVLYSFMPTENLVALTVGRLVAPKMRVVWGIRTSERRARTYGIVPAIVSWLQRVLLSFADLTISNSRAGLVTLGRSESDRRYKVIPNGVDTARYYPDESARARGRELLQLDQQCPVIAIVARLDPVKEHASFLRAAAAVSHRRADVRFLVIGQGSDEYRQSLQLLARDLGIADRICWRQPINDVQALYNAVDLVVSSSRHGEGFSNVIAEAMACGIPVVATDVGDASIVIGHHGRLTAPGNFEQLASEMLAALTVEEKEQRLARSKWIANNFGLARLAERTEQVLRELIAQYR